MHITYIALSVSQFCSVSRFCSPLRECEVDRACGVPSPIGPQVLMLLTPESAESLQD